MSKYTQIEVQIGSLIITPKEINEMKILGVDVVKLLNKVQEKNKFLQFAGRKKRI